jgi:hypothetical protein
MTNSSNKIIGGATLLLTLLLIASVSAECADVEKIAEAFGSLFDTNFASVTVEAFGNEGGVGYWDGAANNPQAVHSYGPPVGGTQSTAYQLYQQAVNAATPTVAQLENASNLPGGGYGYTSTPDAPGMVPMAGNGTMYDAAAVNFGNRRAELISPCAQNAPTFVASSLLPKMNLPGVPSWDVMDSQALASQDFLAPTQQMGTDTVLSSLRNASYDLRNNIPNPINVVSPWMNSTITPDLERRPLDSYVPQDGVYGCGSACARSPLGQM